MTNENRSLYAVLAAFGFIFSSVAATTNVTTVADLIGAVRDAKSGDEIVVMKSGSPYTFGASDVDGSSDHQAGHLYARVKIKLRGETGNPHDVVLVGNANRILYCMKDGNTIRDLTFKNGDCTGYGVTETEPKDNARGGAILFRTAPDTTSVVSNCVFEACKAKNGGGACAGHSGLGSANKESGTYIDCVFTGNSCTQIGGGAIYYAYSVINSEFRNNYSGAGNGGALCSVLNVTGSLIVSNATSSTGGFGGGAVACTLTGCYVASNYAYRCGAAADSRFYSCTNRANKSQGDYLEFGLTSGGPGCYAEDCVFIDVGAANKKTFGKSAFSRCRFDDNSFVSGSYAFSQRIVITNCLITGSTGKSAFRLFQALEVGSEMVNCTMVSNNYYFTANDASYQPRLTMKNCFFYGNTCRSNASYNDVDISHVATNLVSSFQDCILSAKSDAHVPGSGNYNYYSERATFKPGFVGAAKNPENPFAITRRSPAFAKAGIVEGWMSTATDIRGEGFPRLRDGVVNIGCYQCWDAILGFTILFR